MAINPTAKSPFPTFHPFHNVKPASPTIKTTVIATDTVKSFEELLKTEKAKSSG
jgi:hypothetical protein